MSRQNSFTVFFDGSCPLCVREIAFYRRREPLVPIEWLDVSKKDPLDLGLPLGQCDAMRRFHVLCEDGQLKSGAAAFTALWSRYKGFRLIGRILSWPLLCHITEGAYRLFLLLRPGMQALTRAIVGQK